MKIFEDENGLSVYSDESAPHEYTLTAAGMPTMPIQFQSGTIEENGVNGITNEAVLAMLIHRTKSLNAKVPCEENLVAIAHMEKAMLALNSRMKRVSAEKNTGMNYISDIITAGDSLTTIAYLSDRDKYVGPLKVTISTDDDQKIIYVYYIKGAIHETNDIITEIEDKLLNGNDKIQTAYFINEDEFNQILADELGVSPK